jgi:hypothetical protein
MNPMGTACIRSSAYVVISAVLLILPNFGCVTQRTFASPEDATQSLVTAARAHDRQQLLSIFGPGSDDILFCGDPVDDQLILDRFVDAYDEGHKLVTNPDGTMTIVVGKDEWPMPIPLIKNDSGKAWIFDTADGKDEVITRRVGRNELTAVEVCRAICDAQREYAQLDPNHNGIPEYARKFISDRGRKDGLYWPTAEGEKPSPLGVAVAEAQAEGYSASANQSGKPKPFHGYLYRILTAQGKDATGAAEDYVVNGKLIGGFAIVAWPVEYGSSGIMTFITNYAGEVYQMDLGDDTDRLARAMKEFNPDASWTKSVVP